RIPVTSCSGGTSLSMKPLAPACSASYTYSSMSKVVSITTFVSIPSRSSRRRVASIPSSSGMRTSMSTTSGRSRCVSSIASRPSEASPTTSMSLSASRIIRNPVRTRSWSSTIRTLMLTRVPRRQRLPPGEAGLRRCLTPSEEPADISCKGDASRAVHRDTGAQLVPAARPGAGIHVSAVHGDAFAHPDEPVAAAVAGAVALAVVGDDELDLFRAVPDEHVRVPCARVLEGVRETLLDHAVGGQVNPRRQLQGVPFHAQVDGETRVANLRD